VLCTTVLVEVGVDIPDATTMVVLNADRFGLAQLHQMRGRIGRGATPSTCFLVADATTALARSRLRALATTQDGFAVAEEDLRLRGPGEPFGLPQHGAPRLRFAHYVEDADLAVRAFREAKGGLTPDPMLMAYCSTSVELLASPLG
jgi:ATP-dependent DNA helicase RecG